MIGQLCGLYGDELADSEECEVDSASRTWLCASGIGALTVTFAAREADKLRVSVT